MARPVRSAAARARELIAAGYGVKEVDSIGAAGMGEEEEDELNEEISGQNLKELYLYGRGEAVGRSDEKDRSQPKARFSSYDDLDVQPSTIKFRPEKPPGLHLTDPITRSGISKFTTALDFFQLFVTDELLEMIVENTNLYGWLNILDKPSYAKRDGSWENTCVQEIKMLIAFIIFNGFEGRKDIERNWSQATLYSGGWSRRFLSKNRFKALSAMLHVSRPGEEDPTDKLAKIRPMLEHMRLKCRQFFQPNGNLSVDERMVASKGRSPIQQYMPSKPTRYGYKLWCVCDSVSGYTFDFTVYTGRDASRTGNGLGYDVVMNLMSPYCNQGYTVFCDSFFSSLHLATSLLANGTYMCGTMQPWRRGFPDVLKGQEWGKRAKQGEMRYVRQDSALMLQWFDKRVVNMISTLHRGHDHLLIFRRGKDKAKNYNPHMVRMPACVYAYNRSMGGVDLADQMIEAYNCLMKVTRWWKTLFFHMVDVAVLNSYLLFNMWRKAHPDVPGLMRNRGFSHLAFREELVRQLAHIRDDELTPLYTPAIRRKKSLNLSGPHDPDYTDLRRNCQVCYILYRKQHKSYIRCSDPQCNVHLCLNKKRNCFPIWHSAEFDKHRYGQADE